MHRPALFLAVLAALAAVPRPASAQPSSASVDSLVRAYAAEHDFNGTVLVQRGGQPLFYQSFGVADRAWGVPLTNDTRYRVGSITKLFASVLVMQLHQEGRLDVDAPFGRYLPDYPGQGADRVTLHQLMNHTSGLAQFDRIASFQQALDEGMPHYQLPRTSDALLGFCCSGALAAEPGTEFVYNNADYIVLGKVIERVTGHTFEEALRERILAPLGLGNTGMMHYGVILERLAPTYFRVEENGPLVNDLPVFWENWYAAGGMYSTAADLAVFADALFGGDALLGAPARARLLTPALDEYGYGLWSYAFERGGRRFRVAKRPGSIMGANAVLYRLLDLDATVVLLANTNLTDLDVFAQRIGNLLVR